MKNFLLTLLVLLGLQTQAQINLCDSMTASGAQTQLVLQVNNANTFIDYWCTNSTCGSLLGEDSMSLTHNVYNSNLHDTIVTCITYGMGATTTCCVEWKWTGISWARIIQPPYFCCDSITYSIDPSQGFNISLDTTGIVHNPDSIDVWWQVCTNGMCYAGDGMYDYFPQVTTSDTVHVCYDAYLYENGVAEVCTRCDYLIFDGTNWVLFNMNPTSINELQFTWEDDGIIYDLTGRKLKAIPTGTMYIQNRKLYIRK